MLIISCWVPMCTHRVSESSTFLLYTHLCIFSARKEKKNYAGSKTLPASIKEKETQSL